MHQRRIHKKYGKDIASENEFSLREVQAGAGTTSAPVMHELIATDLSDQAAPLLVTSEICRCQLQQGCHKRQELLMLIVSQYCGIFLVSYASNESLF